ncbi:MAG TPA: hypothetical protein PLO27_06555, partial [Marmoricola sp.]|nr:hypothetical protein [Marmoricola sp.]
MSLALISAGCAAQTPGPTSGDCISVKDGVSYAYVWNDAEVSITLSPINEAGVRCEDVTVSLVGWVSTDYPARWPQRVVTTRTITLTKDSDVPVVARIKSMCQNDAYWGEAPEVGHINTAGGVPWQETFVNHMLPHGTGANFAADPMTGGLTANTGPCGPSDPGETTSGPTCDASVPPPTSLPSTKGPIQTKDPKQEYSKTGNETEGSEGVEPSPMEMTKGPVESPTTDLPDSSDCLPVTPTCTPVPPITKGPIPTEGPVLPPPSPTETNVELPREGLDKDGGASTPGGCVTPTDIPVPSCKSDPDGDKGGECVPDPDPGEGPTCAGATLTITVEPLVPADPSELLLGGGLGLLPEEGGSPDDSGEGDCIPADDPKCGS